MEYILILIMLALGCAGRGDKVKTKGEILEETVQKEVFKPAYPDLIEMYNEGLITEFYDALDTIRIKQSSCAITESRSDSAVTPEQFAYLSAFLDKPIDINQDSSLVSILIYDVEKNLLWIEYNDILPRGNYVYFNELPHIKNGIYFYLLRIGMEERLGKFILLR